jgi:Cu/Ag efflux protein CusF
MKVLGAMLVGLLAAGGASAQQPSYPQGQEPATGEKSKATQEIKAEVVSTDAQAKTITVKKSDPVATGETAQMTLSVDPKAESSLKSVKSGDRVKLVCRKDSMGTQIVDKIERVDSRPAGDNPPQP